MLITLTKTRTTKTTEHWLIEHNGTLTRINTTKYTKRRGIDNLRYVICKALKLDKSQFRFIANRRVNGVWLTEWIIL